MIISGKDFGDALAAAAARYIAERQPDEVELRRLGLNVDVMLLQAKLFLLLARFGSAEADEWARAAGRGFCNRVQYISGRPQHLTLQ